MDVFGTLTIDGFLRVLTKESPESIRKNIQENLDDCCIERMDIIITDVHGVEHNIHTCDWHVNWESSEDINDEVGIFD